MGIEDDIYFGDKKYSKEEISDILKDADDVLKDADTYINAFKKEMAKEKAEKMQGGKEDEE